MGRFEPWTLVLAGGDGARLRDLTTLIAGAPIPKQYCRIDGDRSLLEATLVRIAPVAPPSRTLAIVNHSHVPLAYEQLAPLPPENILVQPANRETGPGILYPLLSLARRDPDALVAVFPSDHHVANDGPFVEAVSRGLDVAATDPRAVVLLGVRPTHADPGYGYVECGDPTEMRGVFRVRGFHEKPPAPVARALMARALWNSFVMVFHVGHMLELIAAHRPGDFMALALLHDLGGVPIAYASLGPWNFSEDLLARVTERLLVLEVVGSGWSDWGTRAAIEATFAREHRVPSWMTRRSAGTHAGPPSPSAP